MNVEIQKAGGDQLVAEAGCVTVSLGELSISVSPDGIEVTLFNGDDDPSAWLEAAELRELATGRARLSR